MGKKDAVITKYMQRSTIIADLFNFYLHKGSPVITPENILELDIREIVVPYSEEKRTSKTEQKYRDVVRSVTAMTDQGQTYIVIGIENQSHIHYAMPVKNMVYGALLYARQVEKADDSHRASRDYRNGTSDEFLSGFMKSDRLTAILTLTLYFGAEEWDGPLSIHEMFRSKDEKLLPFLPDYRINLLTPAMIREEDFDKFQSSLRQVLKFIKYSKDKKKLSEILKKDPGFQKLGKDEVNLLNTCTGSNLKMKEDEEVMDVCLAIQGMMYDSRVEALAQVVQSLIKNMGLSMEQSLDILEISEDDRKAVIPLVQ
ncbi:MAG: Rpn family recombination-promoting nuclease/putative transposase [Lachnospiraceae bacterium]|nr:Rpn family recombination-promoting nuclease/putative transposase [Lachnospiraceae bacterium]